MEYHSGGSLPLLGRPRYCPGANANGGYLCETGHCCGETGCCTYYYELWWFWLLWTVLILFSCCCAYRHRRAKQRVQQQQRQRDISMLAYHGASYTSSMLDLSFLASLKLPSYEEVAAQPSTPPPPYSSVFTSPRYPQPPRTADPHLLTQQQGALQHGPLLHQALSDGPSSLSSDNSSSCSCDSCCPSSPCSSSLSAPITYETDTSHASTPSEATPLAPDVTMETIHVAAGRLELHRDRATSKIAESAAVAIDIEEPLTAKTPKLNVVTDKTSPNSKMAAADINFVTISQSLAQKTENEAATSNQHLEATNLSKFKVVDVTGSPLDTASPNSKMAAVDINLALEICTVSQSSPTPNLSEQLEATSLLKPSKLNTDITGPPLDITTPNLTLPVGITAPIKQQLDLKPAIGSPTSPQSPQSHINSVNSCVQSIKSPQDNFQMTYDTATSPQPQRTLILDSNGNSCQDKNPSLVPILAPSNQNLKTVEETLCCKNPKQKTDLSSPGESDALPFTNENNIHPTSVLLNLLTSQGIQNVTKNTSEETELPTVTMLEKGSTGSPSIATSEFQSSVIVTPTTEKAGTDFSKEVVPLSLQVFKAEDLTSPSEFSPQPLNSQKVSENITQAPKCTSPKSSCSDLVLHCPTVPQKLSQIPSGQILNLPTPEEFKKSSASCSELLPAQYNLNSFAISTSYDLVGEEKVKELSNNAPILHLSSAKPESISTLPPDVWTQMATFDSDIGPLSQSVPQKLVATVSLSCPMPNSSEDLEALSIFKPSNLSPISPDVLTKTSRIDVASYIDPLSQSLPQKPGFSCPKSDTVEIFEVSTLLKPSSPLLVDSVSSIALPTSPNLNLEPPFTQFASENLPNLGSDVHSFCPAITIQADQPSCAPSPSSPCSIPSPPASMLLLDPLAAINQSEKSATSSGHTSSLSPTPRNTQSPPKQTLFSPCVDVFEPVNPDWEDDEYDEDDEDDDMGADESQYRHRRLTGDSGIEVCQCHVEDEEEEEEVEKLQKDGDAIVTEKKHGMANSELHDSVDCPVRSQKSTADERSLCNDANDATSENAGNVVIPLETV